MPEEEKKPYDSEAKKKWDKENTLMFSVKFFKGPDKDILDYFERHVSKEVSKSKLIKEALREKIKQEETKA